jgi:hypothetical protein
MKVDSRQITDRLDPEYGRQMAMGLLDFRTNEHGFRISGSPAEKAAGEWIAEQMKAIGLQNVAVEGFPVDGWIFKGAEGSLKADGEFVCSFEAAAFTGSKAVKDLAAQVVYMGFGTADEYEKQSAEGKIVLIDTDSFRNNWYDVVFRQAQERGAVAVMAIPTEPNPGTYSDDIITVHEMETKIDIPAISVSVSTGRLIKEQLEKTDDVEITLNADIEIDRNAEAHFVRGCIPGRNKDRYIILCGHYDAYWEGVQDNASSLGSQLSIAKAMIEAGYEPESTIIFSINGAEEFGHMDTLYAWMTGAEAMIRLHPEYAGKTVLLLNIETSALKQDSKLGFSIADPYRKEMDGFCEELLRLSEGRYQGHYLTGIGMGGDDFIFSINGVPITIHKALDVYTDFTPGGFMSLYHTREDKEELFSDEYFALNNRLFTEIILKYDSCECPPMEFSYFRECFWQDIDQDEIREMFSGYDELNRELDVLVANTEAERQKQTWAAGRKLLETYKIIATEINKLDIYVDTMPGHQIAYDRYADIRNLMAALREGKAAEGLEAFFEKGYNHLIPDFDKSVYLMRNVEPFEDGYPKHFAEGKTIQSDDLYDVVRSIMSKNAAGITDFEAELKELEAAAQVNRDRLIEQLENTLSCVRRINGLYS